MLCEVETVDMNAAHTLHRLIPIVCCAEASEPTLKEWATWCARRSTVIPAIAPDPIRRHHADGVTIDSLISSLSCAQRVLPAPDLSTARAGLRWDLGNLRVIPPRAELSTLSM